MGRVVASRTPTPARLATIETNRHAPPTHWATRSESLAPVARIAAISALPPRAHRSPTPVRRPGTRCRRSPTIPARKAIGSTVRVSDERAARRDQQDDDQRDEVGGEQHRRRGGPEVMGLHVPREQRRHRIRAADGEDEPDPGSACQHTNLTAGSRSGCHGRTQADVCDHRATLSWPSYRAPRRRADRPLTCRVDADNGEGADRAERSTHRAKVRGRPRTRSPILLDPAARPGLRIGLGDVPVHEVVEVA